MRTYYSQARTQSAPLPFSMLQARLYFSSLSFFSLAISMWSEEQSQDRSDPPGSKPKGSLYFVRSGTYF